MGVILTDGREKAAFQLQGNAANLIAKDSLTSLRWYDPDQVQRVVPSQDSQFKNTPSGLDWYRLFHIPHKSRVIDVLIKKSTMHFMFAPSLLRILYIAFLFGVGGCAAGSVPVNPYFEMPPERLSKGDFELYNRALVQLKNNHLDNSIDLWKRFLKHNPRSFRGYNNLGMAHYSNDQLTLSIKFFETALALEPFDRKIKNNLKRALRFRVTILRENKEYAKAIEHLESMKRLTDLEKKEKVALEIETLQDLIYEQVKRTNMLEDYEAFVKKYPDNPKNADEARRLIAKKKPENASLGQRVVSPQTIQSASTLSPINGDSIEIKVKTKKSEEVEDFSEEIQEPVNEETQKSPIKQPQANVAAVSPDMEMKRERPNPPTQVALPKKHVRVVTKVAPLIVRAKPNPRSKALTKLPKNTIVPIFQEVKDWYQVEYQKGERGWIAKKYSQLVN